MGFNRKPSNDQEIIHTLSLGLIQITDRSFPRNSEGHLKPLKTLWRSTMGVQSPSTLATHLFDAYWMGIASNTGISLSLICLVTSLCSNEQH